MKSIIKFLQSLLKCKLYNKKKNFMKAKFAKVVLHTKFICICCENQVTQD